MSVHAVHFPSSLCVIGDVGMATPRAIIGFSFEYDFRVSTCAYALVQSSLAVAGVDDSQLVFHECSHNSFYS